MTIRDAETVITYWREGATTDFESAACLQKGRKYIQALFFCHLALEKILKACVVRTTKAQASFTHNLTYLAGKAQLDLSKAQMAFLQDMTRYNLEGRYPDYYETTRKTVTPALTKKLMQETKELLAWCAKQL